MLYEPTNIIPSTMTQTGTVAATTDNVNIQWQVNGNSAMTMFQIDVMQNNADSTFVYSTGVVTENPTVAQGYSLPFYGKDRFGDYVQFIYQPNQTWAAWSGTAISDGNNYKFRITQFFQENGTACKVGITSNLSDGTTYYFSFPISGMTKYVSFAVANASYFVSGNTIYFNFSHNAGWVVTSGNNSRIITDITFSVSETQPMGTPLSGAVAVSSGDTFYNQFFTAQNSASSFITRTEPTLTITPLTETPVASASQNFTATYLQEQGDNINTVRWQLFNVDDMSAPIDDTGDISTSVLSYEYNGLFDGQSYSVICTVTTESGVSVSATLDFSVQYEQGTYTGNFTAQSLCHEDANLLNWDTVSGIPGVANPENSAVVANGQLSLAENGSVTWSQQMSDDGTLQPLNIQKPWTAVWNGQTEFVKLISSITPTSPDVSYFYRVYDTSFNPSGDLFLTVGTEASTQENGYAEYYQVQNNELKRLGDLLYNGSPNGLFPVSCSFNASGDVLVIGFTTSSGGIRYYKVQNNNEIIYEGNIDFTGEQNIDVKKVIFSPTNAQLLVVHYQSQNGFMIKYTLWQDNGFTPFSNVPFDFTTISDLEMCFNDAGTILAICCSYEGTENNKLFLYSVKGNSFSLEQTITLSQKFSPNAMKMKENSLIICGEDALQAQSFCFLFDASINGVVLLDTIEKNSDEILCCDLSNDKKNVIIAGGQFGGTSYAWAEIYYISENSFIYVKKLVDDTNSIEPSIYVLKVNFSPNNDYLVITKFTRWLLLYDTSKKIYIELNNGNMNIFNSMCTLIFENENIQTSIILQESFNFSVVTITPSSLQINIFEDADFVDVHSAELTYTQQNISSAQLQGKQICNYFAIIDGDGTNIEQYLTDSTFVPEWNNAQGYVVDLLADFNYGLDGGTATATGTGFRLYRRTADGTENIELATLPSTTIALRDYGIKSNESYIYDFYVYDANGAFMGVRSTEATPLKRQFKRFSLLSTQYNESDNCYHVVKEYQFSCNIQDMTVSNNSNKSYVQNFTPYPTVFQSTANYASGTLQALIGFVDMKAYKYWDSTQLMEELNALSTTTNTLFLKDMKGRLWMVDVGTVQMTATQKTREMQVTISLPWTEIGDASNVSIIQTPDDEGWNIDAQVLDVKLDVDVETGLLQVVYPFPYNGTAFYLVGVTPEGVVSAVQPLPSTASQPTDGQLKAVVRHR